MDNKKNTRSNVKKNSGIKLQSGLPPRGRKNWSVKMSEVQGENNSHEKGIGEDNFHHSTNKR